MFVYGTWDYHAMSKYSMEFIQVNNQVVGNCSLNFIIAWGLYVKLYVQYQLLVMIQIWCSITIIHILVWTQWNRQLNVFRLSMTAKGIRITQICIGIVSKLELHRIFLLKFSRNKLEVFSNFSFGILSKHFQVWRIIGTASGSKVWARHNLYEKQVILIIRIRLTRDFHSHNLYWPKMQSKCGGSLNFW